MLTSKISELLRNLVLIFMLFLIAVLGQILTHVFDIILIIKSIDRDEGVPEYMFHG